MTPENPAEPAVPAEPSLASRAGDLVQMVERLNTNVVESNAHIAESNERIGESNKRIAELGRYGQRNRRLLRALALSFAFDLLLTGGLAYNQQKTHDASRAAARAAAAAQALASSNRANQVATCVSSNQVRANDIALWTHVLTLVPPKTAAGTAETKSILDFVHVTFASKDCSKA